MRAQGGPGASSDDGEPTGMLPSFGRAVLVWAVAVGAYTIAVGQRSSFGVAGIDAAHRFGAAATILSLFTVIQLAVYAVAQLPAGILLDKVGSRRMIATGAIVMAVGQVGMALSHTVGLALAARVLIGAGDAVTFVSVLRLIPSWFPTRRVPLFTQLTGIVGQLGQVISAVPFVMVLHHLGWNPAFLGMAGLGLVAGIGVSAWVRDRPGHARPGHAAVSETGLPRETAGPGTVVPEAAAPAPTAPDASGLVGVVKAPGSWLGFWTHMVTSFSVNVFTLMWGYPFLVVGQGLTPGQASGLLTLNVVVAILAGPVIGEFTARHPLRRSWAVIAIGTGVGLAWLMVLVPSTPRPLWQLALFVAVLAVGGPGSVIGFDYARTFNPPGRLGAATGLVNIGGFSAAVAAIFGVGLVLDHVRPGGDYTLGDFRMALAVIFIPWAISMAGVLFFRARTRARMADDGVVVPPLAEAWARWRSRG